MRRTISVVFFNDTATTEIYTLSLHDALPICGVRQDHGSRIVEATGDRPLVEAIREEFGRKPSREDYEYGDGDRKSTRLNSSHANISYAVFCLKKKTATRPRTPADDTRCTTVT